MGICSRLVNYCGLSTTYIYIYLFIFTYTCTYHYLRVYIYIDIIHIHIIFSLSITCKKAKRYPTVKCWESYLFPTIMIGKNKFLFN